MIKQDMRLDEELLKKMIGKIFVKYKCDPFIVTNSVTITVGLYIGDDVYELHNEQQAVDYYGNYDDFALWNIQLTSDENIKSAFVSVEQIDTPINEKIKSIILVNENQIAKDNEDFSYNVWVTRAIIFHLESQDICFEKDDCAFSEEIIIIRGRDLKSDYPKTNTFFLEDWVDGIETEVSQSFIEIE